jgi:hypothetical protein
MPSNESDGLRSAYAAFLKTDVGLDVLRYAETLEKAYILQAIKGQTSDEKASSVSKLEGVVTLRDYILRMSKPAK